MEQGAALIMTTVAGPEEAAAVAARLLEARVAACVQEIPITSHFRWEGRARVTPEVLLLAKTPRDRAPQAVASLLAAHPYQVPEVLMLEAAATAPYLAWMSAETRPVPEG